MWSYLGGKDFQSTKNELDTGCPQGAPILDYHCLISYHCKDCTLKTTVLIAWFWES